ncbi:hypothetical protein SLA2020_459500 [Shorea laevis]
MAGISMREVFRFGHTIFTRPILLLPSKPNNIFSPFSSSTESKRLSLYRPSLSLLNLCQEIKHLFQIQAYLITSGLFRNPVWGGKVLKQSLDLAGIDYTVSIFQSLGNADIFCVNTVIKGYSVSSVPHQALVFYFQMLGDGFVPNSFTFVPLFGCCAKMGCIESAKKCHGQAVKNGVDFELTVQNSLIRMYGCCGVNEFAKKLFVEMSQRDVFSWNSILDASVKNGDLVMAHKLFDAMPERSMVSWNIMIVGYLKGGNPGCALKLFRRMAKMGIRGNESTMAAILSACRRSARLKEGRSVHGFLIKTLRKSNIILDAALIDLYSKCQKVELAHSIFDKMAYRNLVCWNTMILGHCIHGNPEDGLKLFAEMVGDRGAKGNGISPDEITFVGVLCACARAGLLTDGRNYFGQMIHEFSVKPNFGHFWCMANLYASAGLVQEAEEILRNMPVDEDLSSESLVWANLLTSCRFKGDIALGERIATTLIEKEPKNFSYYQLLLNVYAVAGQWEDVNKVKELMKERRIGRMPGCNLVDLKEIVHNLNAGLNVGSCCGKMINQGCGYHTG